MMRSYPFRSNSKGLLDMYNGIDILQTKDYIKIDVHTYIQKFSRNMKTHGSPKFTSPKIVLPHFQPILTG